MIKKKKRVKWNLKLFTITANSWKWKKALEEKEVEIANKMDFIVMLES